MNLIGFINDHYQWAKEKKDNSLMLLWLLPKAPVGPEFTFHLFADDIVVNAEEEEDVYDKEHKDVLENKMSRLMTETTKWYVRPTKTQISLDIHTVCSESSLCAQWVAKDPKFLHANSEDSDQTG